MFYFPSISGDMKHFFTFNINEEIFLMAVSVGATPFSLLNLSEDFCLAGLMFLMQMR